MTPTVQGSDSIPQVSSNEILFRRRGNIRPWWEVISDGGCRRLLQRWPAASPVLALSSVTPWREWSRKQSAVNQKKKNHEITLHMATNLNGSYLTKTVISTITEEIIQD